ncbi:hypothetical protein SLS62_000027 [Diatrype stigma]|uniref:Uncharacterized protein n=1 Tax=Diatrype stigma TaxID=117547 RepID=A0AAN9V1S4_9PEZI
MADDDSTCSGNQNSTDCLLKALLGAIGQQNKAKDAEFNWDPLSFGFTAPVGILAALFTFLTVVQMIIASGPGRRRSDKQVIGRWSSKKKTRLNWTEMRFLTIVPTPVLRASSLKQELLILFGHLRPTSAETNITDQSRLHWKKLWTVLLTNLVSLARKCIMFSAEKLHVAASLVRKLDRPNRHLQSLPAYMQSIQVGFVNPAAQPSRAKWLVHLDELNLEKFIFEKSDVEHNAADYLPSDLQAVPAYSEVGCAVALAAASGISSLKTDELSPYPLIIGNNFQLSFREHPLLGSVGVFSRYGRRELLILLAQQVNLLLALCYAEGEVLSRIKGLYVSARQLYADDNPFRRCGCGTAHTTRICSSTGLVHEKHKNLLWLIAAKTPDRLPAIFPSRSVNLRNMLTVYILQAQSWAHTRGALVQDDIQSLFLSNFGPITVWWAHDPITVPHPETREGISYLLASMRIFPANICPPGVFWARREICGAYTEVFQLCLRFLHDAEDFESWWHALLEKQAELYRKAILVQIQQLDRILAAIDQNLLECRRVTIYNTAQAFLTVAEDVATHTLDADRLNTQSPTSKTADPSSSWESPRTRSFRHCVGTLRTLDALLTPREAKSDSNSDPAQVDSEFARQERRLKTHFVPLHWSGPLDPCPARDALLARLKSTVDGYKMVQEGPDGQEEPGKREPRMRTMEEAIDDVIIWRIVLLGLLFLTAPDNSVILDSGLWKHVIPLL